MLSTPAAMKPYSQLVVALWWLSAVAQATVAIAMFRKKLFREMPVFFAYTVFHVVQFVVAMIAYRTSYAAYFYVYWGTEVIDALLMLFVIQEIFSNVFRPYEALRSVGVTIFRWTLLCLIVVTVAMAIEPIKTNWSELVTALMVVQRSTLFIQAGMIFFLMLFARLFGLTWRSYVFGISLGFGTMGCISGVASALMTYTGYATYHWYSYLVGGGFELAIIIWLYYVMAPSTSFEIDVPRVDSSRLSVWNDALGAMLNR